MNNWTRRSLLIGGALAALPAAAYGAGKLLCGGLVRQRTDKADISLLKAFYPDSTSASALGRRYLSLAGLTSAASLERLQENKRIASAIYSGCPGKTILAVELACREDFRAGRFCCIDGWVLARTELDVAALCAA